MVNLNITDIKESVKVGEAMEDRLAEELKEKLEVDILKLPDFSDMDRFVVDNPPYFLEIKCREEGKYYKDAMCPFRKYLTASMIQDKLKLKVFALFYFKDRKNIGYWYDLTTPLYFKEVTRRDRGVKDKYAFYKPFNCIELNIEEGGIDENFKIL